MDPFRIGLAVILIAAGIALLTKALPELIATVLGVTPAVILLAFIFWLFRALVEKLLS